MDVRSVGRRLPKPIANMVIGSRLVPLYEYPQVVQHAALSVNAKFARANRRLNASVAEV
jgi:hypothetical protein